MTAAVDTAEAGAWAGAAVCGPACAAVGAVVGFGVGAWATNEAWNAWNEAQDGDEADSDSDEGGQCPTDRPDNQKNPEDAAESISKAQEKLRKRDRDRRNWDPNNDWGDMARPKGSGIDSTKKSTNKNWKNNY